MSNVENNKKIILVLATNPLDTSPLRLDKEVRAINEKLDRAKQSEHFEIKQWSA